MYVSLIFKTAGVGLLVCVVYQILSKAGRDEQAMLTAIAGVVIVLLMLVGEIAELLNTIRTTFGL